MMLAAAGRTCASGFSRRCLGILDRVEKMLAEQVAREDLVNQDVCLGREILAELDGGRELRQHRDLVVDSCCA